MDAAATSPMRRDVTARPRCRRACIRSARSWRASPQPCASSVPLTLGQELTVNMSMKVATVEETVTVTRVRAAGRNHQQYAGHDGEPRAARCIAGARTHLHRAGADGARRDRRWRRRRERRRAVEPQQLVPHRRRQQRQQRAGQPARRPLDGSGARVRGHRQPVLGGTRRCVRRDRQRRHARRAPTRCRAAASCSTATNRSTRRIPFSKAQGSGQAPFSQQRGGAFLGGPIKRDRMHYFGTYEGVRLDQTAIITSPLVPAGEREVPNPSKGDQFFVRTDNRLRRRTTRCSCAIASTSRWKRTAASAG